MLCKENKECTQNLLLPKFSHLQGIEDLFVGMADVRDNLGKPNQELVSWQLVYQLLNNLHR